MTKLTILLLFAFTLAGDADAQTITYNMPAGLICYGGAKVYPQTVEGCTFHNLQPAQPSDGSALPPWALPYAWTNLGAYYSQIDFQQFEGQNAAYYAVYCIGGATWQTALMDNGDTLFTADCTTGLISTNNLGAPNMTVHAEVQAHSYKVGPYSCGGGKGSHGTCTRFDWAIDSGFVNITPL
jgi:hypothetical protein